VQPDLVEPLREHLVAGLHAEHEESVAPPEIHLANGPPDQPRARRDHRLGEIQVLLLQRFVAETKLRFAGELPRRAERDELRRRRLHQQNIIRLDRKIGRVADRAASPQHGEDIRPFGLAEAALRQGASHQRRGGQDAQLRDIVGDLKCLGEPVSRAVRQQPPANGHQVNDAHGRKDEAQPRELEEPKCSMAALDRDGVDQQVRGRPDQRAHSAELGRIGEGDEQARRGHAAGARAGGQRNGQKNRDRRGAVDECRHETHRAKHDQDHQRGPFRQPGEPRAHRRDRARGLQTRAQHKHRSHRDRGGIAETGHALIGRDPAVRMYPGQPAGEDRHQHEHAGHHHRNQRAGVFVGDEKIKRRCHDQEHQRDFHGRKAGRSEAALSRSLVSNRGMAPTVLPGGMFIS